MGLATSERLTQPMDARTITKPGHADHAIGVPVGHLEDVEEG